MSIALRPPSACGQLGPNIQLDEELPHGASITNRQMNQKSGAARNLSAQSFTEKQGQYLAFIYTYSHMFRRPPAETDMQRHFQVSPPSVHQMIVTLERNGLIRRQPGVARSIQILVAPEDLPILNWLKINQS